MARPVNKPPPIHPGELLREDMAAVDLSARALAEQAEQRSQSPFLLCQSNLLKGALALHWPFKPTARLFFRT